MDERPETDEPRDEPEVGGDPRDPDAPAHEPADADEAAEIAEGHS